MIKSNKPFSGVVSQTAGIYQYHNSYHDRYYVGQTTNLTSRLAEHPALLVQNKHRNQQFQNDYNELVAKNLNPHDYIHAEILEMI